MKGDSVSYHFADRVVEMQPSATLAVSDSIRALRQQGHDVVDLGGGEPDFPTPEHICRVAAEAMLAGDTHYVASAGTPQLRNAIARKLKRDNGIEVGVDSIIVTPGAKSALFSAVLALVQPGDDVLMFDPGWVSYEPMASVAGARTVRIALDPGDNYRVTRELILQHITPNARLMIINTPNNPSGRVLSLDELNAIASVAVEHNLIVISDEIYEKITYDGNVHISTASLPTMADRTLTVNGFSKAYAMTGWRLGYVAGPTEIIRQVAKIHSHSITCAASFSQAGAVAALEGPQDFIDSMVEAWDQRRHLIAAGLNDVPGFNCPMPEGAFYAMPDVSGTGLSGQEVARVLIEQARVGVTPGGAFGDVTQNHIRLSFANSDQAIEEALTRIRSTFAA
ncbi:MAG TPA: pyridoxal phosphate-dependent aminotransferase [Nitrolancea sp.]|nr:pyridoxal phosphate-dependent aminotransferase [Nitrolancea sp.]